jgi:hypothetical protein
MAILVRCNLGSRKSDKLALIKRKHTIKKKKVNAKKDLKLFSNFIYYDL